MRSSISSNGTVLLVAFTLAIGSSTSFTSQPTFGTMVPVQGRDYLSPRLYAKLTDQRKRELGVEDDDDEYDLSVALSNNTDPLITKIIAGSFILVVIALLVVGLIIPMTTDYGEGVCNPLLSGGRC